MKATPTALVRLVLETSDLVAGIRAREELLASKECLIDLVVWIDNPRVPVDKTVTFTREDCDVIVSNEADLQTYYCRLARFAKSLNILRD